MNTYCEPGGLPVQLVDGIETLGPAAASDWISTRGAEPRGAPLSPPTAPTAPRASFAIG